METLYSTCTVTKESGISTRQLYYWEMIGLICPRYETFGMRQFRRYTQHDLEILKSAKRLLDQGYTLQSVKQTLSSQHREDHGRTENASSSSSDMEGVEVIHL